MAIPGILVAVDFETTGYTEGFEELPLQIGIAAMADGRFLPEYNPSNAAPIHASPVLTSAGAPTSNYGGIR